MNVLFDLLEDLHAAGLQLTEDGTALRGDRSKVTPELLERLRFHKSALLELYAGLKDGCTCLGWMIGEEIAWDVDMKRMAREIENHNRSLENEKQENKQP